MRHIDIGVDFGGSVGRIKRLHGVNNGPVCYGSLVDVSQYYRELKIPYIRLHDPNWPHPREVDIYTIFPDFERDPDDPACYHFEQTDNYLKSILDTGAKIMYRLGVSIEHTQNKYYIHPPDNFQKWARICLRIIQHYNDGWADGYQYGIRYWEIWNEPEGLPGVQPEKNAMWSGSQEQYLKLYEITSKTIKKYNSHLKVGGFGATMTNPEFNRKFLEYCRSRQLPLDFFSWHTYTDNPLELEKRAWYVRALLDEYGYTGTESHLNEWNYFHIDPDIQGVFSAGNEYSTQKVFQRLKGIEGASFDAATLILLQDAPVDEANYYDGQPTSYWSFFNFYGVPEKSYYAFKAFSQLVDYPLRREVKVSTDEGVYACAGVNDNSEGAVLISNFCSDECIYRITLKNLPGSGHLEYYQLDHRYNLDMTDYLYSKDCDSTLEKNMSEYSIALLKWLPQNKY